MINMDSLELHNHRPMNFSLPVTLTSSDNEYMMYPAKGVIKAYEQGADLSITVAVFQSLNPSGTLNPPVVVKNPVFTYGENNLDSI